jgi:hypothetical protein
MRITRSLWVVAALVLLAAPALAKRDRFVDSDEFKEKKRALNCAITDYGDLVEEDKVDWAWTSSSAHVGAPGPITIKPVKNVSDVTDPELASKVEADLKQAFARIGKSVGPGGQTVTACIYWVERANMGRAMIPFAGAHLMQAGVGIELTIADASGTPIAKIRNDGREGQQTSDAAAAVVDAIVNYLRDH